MALSSNMVGKLGELASQTNLPKTLIQINGRYRIPDLLDKSQKLLIEVKNVAYQSFTRQLRDYVAYCQQNQYTMILRVRDGCKLSQPLIQAWQQGLLTIETIEPFLIPW